MIDKTGGHDELIPNEGFIARYPSVKSNFNIKYTGKLLKKKYGEVFGLHALSVHFWEHANDPAWSEADGRQGGGGNTCWLTHMRLWAWLL
ncbi:hypothetical protein [Candidatus Paracaedibacter symbiosus]|uniref:hypothetical protein n=1 Tax=Candidatus Paracaedibacter symbiosus TaxID=244582 RepID=UPI001E5252DC|nr:hypothetical protein [Candidatus Paracaedibacter symbiosus]